MEERNNLALLLGYAGNHKYLTLASWVLSALSALIALVPFVYIWKILQSVLTAAPNIGSAENLVFYGWMAVLSAVLSILIYIAALMCSHIAAFRIAANLRKKTLHHIAGLPLGFMDEFGSGKLRRIIDESSGATETYLAHQLPDKAAALATPFGLIILLLFFDWRLGLLSLVPIALGFIIMSVMTGKRMQKSMIEYQNALGNMSNEAVEYVRGISVIKTFGQSIFSFKRFKGAIDNYYVWVMAYCNELKRPMMFYTTAVNSVFVFLILSAFIFTTGGVTPEFLINLTFYIIITPVIAVTLTKIMYLSENRIIVDDAMNKIYRVLNCKPMEEPAVPEHPVDSSIEFSDVTFTYNGASSEALSNFSLKINSGEHVAFVGPSGSGKTTAARLAARFNDVTSGSIKIGGVDVRNIAKEELMNTVSFVFQDSKLLKMSIYDNVRMSKPGAGRDEVMQALMSAQCMDIIGKFPSGIDTVIGSKGVYLSGGEQQRIAIARVILKNAPIVILDEATAFADPDNEQLVQAAFSELSKNKTVITIAHRLSTVKDCDRIFVLKDGSIEASGKHDELLLDDSLYSSMWNQYLMSVQWKVQKEAGAV